MQCVSCVHIDRDIGSRRAGHGSAALPPRGGRVVELGHGTFRNPPGWGEGAPYNCQAFAPGNSTWPSRADHICSELAKITQKGPEGARPQTNLPSPPPTLPAGSPGLGVADHLTHLDAFESHGFRTHRFRPLNHLGRTASAILGFEHDHRQAVAPVGRSSPVAGDKTRRLRDPRHDLFVQALFRGIRVTDVDPYDDCVHLAPPIKSGHG